MKKLLWSMGLWLICFVVLSASSSFAKCEVELAALKQAEQRSKDAKAKEDAAGEKEMKAARSLQDATNNLNDAATALHLLGSATTQSAVFGRESTNPSFLDSQKQEGKETNEYLNAKNSWQAAKDASNEAASESQNARAEVQAAQEAQDAAKAAYDKCMAAKEDDYLKGPEPLKVDEKLNERIKEIIPEQVLYDTAKGDNTISDIACVLRSEGGKTLLEVSILTKGQGASFRRWSPDRPTVVTKSGERITPVRTANSYFAKESIASGTAPILFAAIGSQYTQHAAAAQSSPGTSCPTGSSPGTSYERGRTAKAIDRAGMAAGMGLLTSQAKGEIKGLKCTFDVTGHEQEMKPALLKYEAVNSDTHKTESMTIPLKFNVDVTKQWNRVSLTGPAAKVLDEK